MKGKTRFICAQRRNFTFLISAQLNDSGVVVQPAGSVHTMSYFIRNDSKEPITGIEVVWNWKPDAMNIWPPRPFAEFIDGDRRYSTRLSSLSPGEDLLFELIAFGAELPRMVSCRCDQSVARHVELNFYERLPSWKQWRIKVLAFIGACTAIYLMLKILQVVLISP